MNVANVVETEANIVGRKVIGERETDAEEIADRAVVFGAIEPPGRHSARIERLGEVNMAQTGFEQGNELGALGRGGLRFFVRWHGTGTELAKGRFPSSPTMTIDLRNVGERFEINGALAEVAGVAIETVALEKWMYLA